MTTPDNLPETDVLGDPSIPPAMALAALPASLIVAGLQTQLSLGASGYSDTDYLQMVISTHRLLLGRDNDSETAALIRRSFGAIYRSVVDAVMREWPADLFQMGLDAESADYTDDVYELYKFFICDRRANANEIVFASIVAQRTATIAAYKKTLDRKNQSFVTIRKNFTSLDDAVVWFAIPQVISTFRAENGPHGTLREALMVLDLDTRLLKRLAWVAPDDSFIGMYCAQALGPLAVVHARSSWQERFARQDPCVDSNISTDEIDTQ